MMAANKIFSEERVQIVWGNWQEVSLQVKGITVWKVKKLILWNNFRETIVKQIAHIYFSDLCILRLDNNAISSIEVLGRVNMPNLTFLYLQDNKIISVRAMRKAAWSSLEKLIINRNNFGDAGSLVEGCFPQLSIFYLYGQQEINQFVEQCFIAKMQAHELCEININKTELCFERSIHGVLRKRWLDTEIQ